MGAEASDTLSKMLQKAKLKRQDADCQFDNLVELLVKKFSKLAAAIARLKMEG